MKNKLLYMLTTVMLFLIPEMNFAQAPNLGSTANFVLYTSNGSVNNTGESNLIGHVGTNNGSSDGFGNVNGVMHDNNIITTQAELDLLFAYNELNSTSPDFVLASSLGGGQTLNAGVYDISEEATLEENLILDGQGDINAVFVFKINGAFSTGTNSSIKLINEAQACNVFWKVEGFVNMATGTTMRGTVIANNGGINMNVGDTLEGRVLSTSGAISIDGVFAYTPTGCSTPTLVGPAEPTFGEADCYGIFCGDGSIQNQGTTNVNGDVGTNVGLTVGFDPLLVTGDIHAEPNESTAQASADLSIAYNYLNGLAYDIELLYPNQFGANLVLTPHTYFLDGSTTFTNTLYLDAQGVTSAVFVIKINGNLETSTYSKVILTNGALAANVYWLVSGAVDINENSTFNGNVISQGSVNLFTGVEINGRVLTSNGAIKTYTTKSNADISEEECKSTSTSEVKQNQNSVTVYPNPFSNSTTFTIDDASQGNQSELRIFNVLGVEVMSKTIIESSTTINTSKLPSGMYVFKVIGSDNSIHSGRMILQK